MTETGTGVAASVVAVDMKLEVVVIPISDTKRAKGFLRQAWLAAGRDTGRIRGRAAYHHAAPVARCSSAEIAPPRHQDPRKDFG